jgi:hypothetical protein
MRKLMGSASSLEVNLIVKQKRRGEANLFTHGSLSPQTLCPNSERVYEREGLE